MDGQTEIHALTDVAIDCRPFGPSDSLCPNAFCDCPGQEASETCSSKKEAYNPSQGEFRNGRHG
jgi:hypothetical protein